MWKLGTGTFKAIYKPIRTLPQVLSSYSPPHAKEQHLMSFGDRIKKNSTAFFGLMIETGPTYFTVITAEKSTPQAKPTQAAGTLVHQSHLPYGTIPIFLMISISTTNSNTS
jgi:hypothetical protein